MLPRFTFAALGVAVLTLTSVAALAGADDYAFEPVAAEMKKGDDVTVAVRLIHKPTGKPVSDAVVFRKRVDMAPEGMAEMESPVTPVSSTEPGVYAFKTDMPMAGRYLLSLEAKVQGEPETVVGKVIIKATR
jgi:hypothetical protein